MITPLCGNFQSACTSNAQCAFNTCVSGFCSGPLSSSATSSTSSVPTSTITQPSSTSQTATLPLGAVCTPSSTPCANGSQCYAVNSMLILYCGNFQAVCTSNSQCAFNTCVNGFCSGALPSSIGSGGLAPTSSSTGNYTSGSSATPTAVQANGAGKVVGGFGALAIVAIGAAMFLWKALCGSFRACLATKCAFRDASEVWVRKRFASTFCTQFDEFASVWLALVKCTLK
jgi:hypothetical protein